MMWVPQKRSVTALAKIGAVFMDVIGVLVILFGLLIVAGGALVGNSNIFEQNGITGFNVGGFLAVIGVVVGIIGLLHLLIGIFAWRGAEPARIGGIIIGLLFGILGVLGALGGTNSASGNGGSGIGLSLAISLAYLYTGIVFLLRYRERA